MVFSFVIDEIVSIFSETWVTEIIEKKKIEKAKEMLSTQIVDFFNDEFVKKYESEMWFSKCFNMICRDKYLAQIFCHFFELNRPISIESLCSSFVEKLLKEYPEYVPIQKQIFDAIKWLTSDIIRILRKCDDIPKEYVMHFDMYDLGQQSNDIQLETLRGVRQILEKFESNSSKNSSPNSIYTLYGIIQKNISYSEKQYEILEWVSKEKNVKEAMVCLAFLERNEGSVERAIELFEYVADNYPEEVDLYNNVGCLYLDNGEYKKANKCFYNVAFSDNGNKCYAYYNLALWEYTIANKNIVKPPTKGKYYYSINMINHALKYTPSDIDSMNFKAYLLMISKQNMNEAYSLLCSCVEKENRYEFRVNLAIFYLLNRDFDKAEAEVNTLLQIQANREDSFLYGLLGNIYGTYDVDRIDDAIRMLQKAYDYSSDVNYLSTANELRKGNHIDSVFLNGSVIEIYTDHEVIEMYKSIHNN